MKMKIIYILCVLLFFLNPVPKDDKRIQMQELCTDIGFEVTEYIKDNYHDVYFVYKGEMKKDSTNVIEDFALKREKVWVKKLIDRDSVDDYIEDNPYFNQIASINEIEEFSVYYDYKNVEFLANSYKYNRRFFTKIDIKEYIYLHYDIEIEFETIYNCSCVSLTPGIVNSVDENVLMIKGKIIDTSKSEIRFELYYNLEK